jgi:hypothetical protein
MSAQPGIHGKLSYNRQSTFAIISIRPLGSRTSWSMALTKMKWRMYWKPRARTGRDETVRESLSGKPEGDVICALSMFPTLSRKACSSLRRMN